MSELDVTDLKLVALLAAGKSPTAAGAEIGVTGQTVYRRKAKPAFQTALMEARAGLYVPLAQGTMLEMPAVVARLSQVIRSEDARDADAIKACAEMTELHFKFQDQVDIRQALAEVQNRLATIEAGRASGVPVEPSEDRGDSDVLPPEIAPQTGV